jgi:hypothetical protein
MPHTTSRYSDAWHAAQDAAERAWLDAWMRGRICPTTLQPYPAPESTVPAAVRVLVIAGSH